MNDFTAVSRALDAALPWVFLSIVLCLMLFFLLQALSHALREPPFRPALQRSGPQRTRIRATPWPERLRERWLQRYPDRTEADFEAAARGLQDYFTIVALARGDTALPSDAADSVWHLLLEDPESYHAYTLAALGRPVAHIEKERMGSLQPALALTWAVACTLDGIDPKRPRTLPPLFALDKALSWTNGHVYTLTPSAYPTVFLEANPGLSRTWAPWLALGLVSTDEGFTWRTPPRQAPASTANSTDSGSSCGAATALMPSGDAGDHGSCDAGGHGSSCGSSCGGSCGGGCGGS